MRYSDRALSKKCLITKKNTFMGIFKKKRRKKLKKKFRSAGKESSARPDRND